MKKFELDIKVGDTDIQRVPLEASSIISALEKLHRYVQKDLAIPFTDYKVVAMAQVYGTIRSEYLVPGGPNPDTTKPL